MIEETVKSLLLNEGVPFNEQKVQFMIEICSYLTSNNPEYVNYAREVLMKLRQGRSLFMNIIDVISSPNLTQEAFAFVLVGF